MSCSKCEQPYLMSITHLIFNSETLRDYFSSSSIGTKLGFLNVGIRLYFQDVPNSQRNFGIFRCCSSWISQFFPVHKKDLFFFSLKASLDCTSKFFPIHQRFEKLGFLKSLLIATSYLWSLSLIAKRCVGNKIDK